MEIKLKSDSRKVVKGDTFIALKNIATDGHDFIEKAIENGATKIICERGNYNAETVIVPDTNKYYNEYLYNNYYKYFKDIKLIGITGTNGKTTTAYLTYQMLNLLGKKCAYIGTIGFYCNNQVIELNNTTPDIGYLYELFLKAKENDCEYMVMEVSSIALDRDRIYGLEFDEVAFTNLTIDHMDYHKTIDNYIKAKQLLFKRTRNNKTAIINVDDKYYEKFIYKNNNNILIGENNKTISNIRLTNQNTTFDLTINNKTYNIETSLIGKFNVYNYITALLLVNNLGIDINDILNVNKMLNHPPGRMQLVKYNSNSIFIDYAHTPDAVENAIKSANEYKEGKVITILGCGGNRDATKRPIMGDIATKLSDFVIFTNDNPRCEDEDIIINDILNGVNKDNYIVIKNRKEATKKGIEMLKDKDILLLLGKGHEDYQIIGKEKIHYSDLETVNEIINDLN